MNVKGSKLDPRCKLIFIHSMQRYIHTRKVSFAFVVIQRIRLTLIHNQPYFAPIHTILYRPPAVASGIYDGSRSVVKEIQIG